MNNHYYIDIAGNKDGPHDLVTIMRRIRANKITQDTQIFVNDSMESISAKDVPDLKTFFFHHSATAPATPATQKNHASFKTKNSLFNIRGIIHDGWVFTSEHNIMTAFAGAVTLVSLLISVTVADTFGIIPGAILAWIIFVMLHYIYLVFALRLYRGQPISADFMNNKLSPVLPILFLSGFSFALMTAGAFILLVVPAAFVTVYYIFVPFFILDRRMNMVQAMYASRLLISKFNRRYFYTIFFLVLAYAGSVILIVPMPLTMPMFAAALIKAYEEMSAA